MNDIIEALPNAVIVLTSAALALTIIPLLTKIVRIILSKILHKEEDIPQKSYTKRLDELTSNLIKSSREVDFILEELTGIAKDRELTVNKLEADLVNLKERENDLKANIEVLQKVPIPAAEYFAKVIQSGDKRNAKRDYLLFGAGVIITTLIALIIQFIIPLIFTQPKI